MHNCFHFFKVGRNVRSFISDSSNFSLFFFFLVNLAEDLLILLAFVSIDFLRFFPPTF